MLKFFQNTRIASLVFGSAALALISVSPVAAQGVPAGLLRLRFFRPGLQCRGQPG